MYKRQQLLKHPDQLKILGDGNQSKSYLYVQDCISAMLTAIGAGIAREARHNVEIYNLGVSDCVTVKDSAGYIAQALGLCPEISYTGGRRGWIGDNPIISLDTHKICSLGWAPSKTIKESIRQTVRWMRDNQWIFTERN